MNIPGYLSEVQKVRKTGAATEHSYRSALQHLFASIDEGIVALNEPKRVKCGAPDFLMSRNDVAFGHAEAKDIDKDISVLKGHDADQKQRFLKALPNLIYTNCLDFEFFRNGASVGRVSIADYLMGIQPKPENFGALENHLRAFAAQKPQTITSSEKLAEIMAGKAALIKDVLTNVLREDKEFRTELSAQYSAFQERLIHDITPSEFADIYAETVAYGMFAARLHDSDLDTFSRQKALDLLPRSNPFLRALFSYIAGPNLDDRIRWIIDDLAVAFQAANVKKLMANFGALTGRNDPFLHFYETFLTKYNPAKKKARGVWYTPEAVVNFIVRAVDDVLRSDFGLSMGLADTSKVTIDWDTGQRGLTKRGLILKAKKNAMEKKEVHRVQILDPATGTGTFLAEVLKQIAPKVKAVAAGMWSQYVEKELIPRLHGFELLMASYAMCHMKLDMVLRELGYAPSGESPRLGVYLTNALEEGDPANQTLPFAQWLSNEARQANAIKRDMPIMCVIGNPPYSGESKNKGDWISALMGAYKKEPGGKSPLKEKTSKWINDDYVKFIRMSEHMIAENGSGVLGFITNHAYIDNPTYRGVRWHLLKTFDKIYVLDLHGSSKKKEVSPSVETDKNVFDIQPGVAVMIAVKTEKTGSAKGTAEKQIPLAMVLHADAWGSRASKYDFLWANGISTVAWKTLAPAAPLHLFRPWNDDVGGVYGSGFRLTDLFVINGNGVVTKRDDLCIQPTKAAVNRTLDDILTLDEQDFRTIHRLPDDVRDWQYAWAKKDVADNRAAAAIVEINYRPFDSRWMFYSGVSRGFVGWPVEKVMRNYLHGENIGLLAPKALRDPHFAHCFVTDRPSEAIFLSGTTGSNAINFPLYVYATGGLAPERRVNFHKDAFDKLVHLSTCPYRGQSSEVDVFDYVYGILHCTEYRTEYREFLKLDFPSIPWPPSPDVFWSVADKGGELRRLHLMEPQAVGQAPYPFSGDGDGVVGKPDYRDGKIWINDTQHFADAPEVSWHLQIGGYQPARKWLKDRRGEVLSFEDILHYQRVIKVLAETHRIMGTIRMRIAQTTAA